MQINYYQRPRAHYWLPALAAGLLVTLFIIWLMTLLITPQAVTRQSTRLPVIEFIPIQPTGPVKSTTELEQGNPRIPPKLPTKMDVPAFNTTTNQPVIQTMQPLSIAPPALSADIQRPAFKPAASPSKLEAPTFDEELYPLLASQPVYPGRAKRAGIEGWVNVAFTITTEGSVSDIEILAAQPEGVFENSTRNAIQHWRFKPQLLLGKPTARRVVQTILFELAP